MIAARFDLAQWRGNDADKMLVKCQLDQVPEVNETININGEPYIVIERGWAIDPEKSAASSHYPICTQYAYIRVLPFSKKTKEK
jgi:hypothetical protein